MKLFNRKKFFFNKKKFLRKRTQFFLKWLFSKIMKITKSFNALKCFGYNEIYTVPLEEKEEHLNLWNKKHLRPEQNCFFNFTKCFGKRLSITREETNTSQ